MQYKVIQDGKLWNSKGQDKGQVHKGDYFYGTSNGVYVTASNGDYTKLAWLQLVTDPPVTPPPADVHPVENTLTMSDGSVWHSTAWAKQNG